MAREVRHARGQGACGAGVPEHDCRAAGLAFVVMDRQGHVFDRGFCPVTSTKPSRTHCQNCFCVVQNSLSFAQTIRAVFFAIALIPACPELIVKNLTNRAALMTCD